MRSGLAKLGISGIAAILLLPPLFLVALHIGVRTYCTRTISKDTSARLLLARLPEMNAALIQARVALKPFQIEDPIDASRSAQFSRWIMETARNAKVELKGLVVTSLNEPASLTPALSAEFHCEDKLSNIVHLVYNLQDRDMRIIVFDSLQLTLLDAQVPQRYTLNMRLRSHLVAPLPL